MMARALNEARADLLRAQLRRDDLIVKASQSGMSLRAIAMLVGLSHAGVAKVLARSVCPSE